MLTPSCDLLPPTSFSSLLIDSAYQQQHLLPLEPGMSDAEALTLADFDFPDEEAVQQAEDAWFVGRQVGEAKLAARKVRPKSVSEAVNVAPTKTDLGEESAAASGYGYTAFRAANPDPNGKKRKGRPVGWRKSVHMKPKTEVLDVASSLSAPTLKPHETKNEEEDEIKVESAPSPALDVPLSPDSDMPKADVKASHLSYAPASTGYAAFRLANPGVKKLGRPVGWKMGVHAKRNRIDKDRSNGKGGKKLAGSMTVSKAVPSTEMKGQEERMPSSSGQQDGEVSMQLDQKPALVKSSLQLNSPDYSSVDNKQEASEFDEDGFLPASFWEGVLTAANTPTSSTASTASEIILKPKLSTEPSDDGEARRDSAFDSISSPVSSLINLDQHGANETNDESENGISDMSHFSA